MLRYLGLHAPGATGPPAEAAADTRAPRKDLGRRRSASAGWTPGRHGTAVVKLPSRR